MYTSSIFMLLSWPAIIVLSYFAVRLALIVFERKQRDREPGKE